MIIVEIAGFLGDDPEERFTANGKRVITLRVAARVRQGGKDETVWWRVNIWGDRFDKMIPHLKKGSPIIIVGDMAKPETYTGRDGTVQISLTLNAEMIKFSPFGRPDRPAESQGSVVREKEESSAYDEAFAKPSAKQEYGIPTYAGAGVSQEGPSFAGDDLPF
jgi:single-strand DNA-binding protein